MVGVPVADPSKRCIGHHHRHPFFCVAPLAAGPHMHNSSLRLTDICGGDGCGFNTDPMVESFTKFYDKMTDLPDIMKPTPYFPDCGRSTMRRSQEYHYYCRDIANNAGDFEIVDNAVGDSSKSTAICIRIDAEAMKRDVVHCHI